MKQLHRAPRLGAFALGLWVTAIAWPLAVTPLTTISPPSAIGNAFVRITAEDASGSSYGGTGSVISLHHDASGPAGWFCVLTADHVVTVNAGAMGSAFTVAFGNEGAGGLSFASATHTINVLGGPANGSDRVDLAVMGIRVPDLSALPSMVMPELGTVEDGTTIYMAGYGDQATLDGVNRRYDVVPSFGTLLAGFNGVDSQPESSVAATGVTYRYDSLQATTMFGPPAPDPAIQGEAHVLSGDSGGPSWTFTMTGWDLVGVHSTSQSHFGGGAEWVEEGDEINDVRVGSYRQWIEDSCAAVVPEPSTFAALAGSLAMFALRRRGGRGRAKDGS